MSFVLSDYSGAHAFSWNWCDNKEHYTLDSLLNPIVICDTNLQMCYRTDNKEEMDNFANGRGYVYRPPEGVFSRIMRSFNPSSIEPEEIAPDYADCILTDISFVVARKL